MFLFTELGTEVTYVADVGASPSIGLDTVFNSVPRKVDVDLNQFEGASQAYSVDPDSRWLHRMVPGRANELAGGYPGGNRPAAVTVFDNFVLVADLGAQGIRRFSQTGQYLGMFARVPLLQGMATDGTHLYVSQYVGSGRNIFIKFGPNGQRLGSIFAPLIPGPFRNIFDFAYDAGTGRFFGLTSVTYSVSEPNFARAGSQQIVEFAMGDAFASGFRRTNRNLTGIGQYNLLQPVTPAPPPDPVPEPDAVPVPAALPLFLAGLGLLGLSRRRA